MGREPEKITAQRRALGGKLATFRQAAGLTQGELAERVFVDRTTVAHLERGRGSSNPDLWEALDTAVSADGSLVHASMHLQATREAHERQSRNGALAEVRARADRLREQQEVAVARLSLAGSLVAGDGGALSLAALQAMSGAFQMADRQLGGGLLYGQVVRYIRAEVAPALLDPPRGVSTPDLFSAAASFAEIAGWMAHDGGHDDRAQAHFGQSYHLATAARNVVLSANISASLAHLAIHLGQSDDAVRIATAGLNWATRVDSAAHLVARLHAMRARALAATGRVNECRSSLSTAHALVGKNSDSSSAGWIAGFDRAALAAESALCLYALGALAEAEAEARTVIALRVGDRVRSRALGQLTLARILVKAGRVDEAATTAVEVCDIAAALNSARVHTGLTDLADMLTVHPSIPEVTVFLDRLTQYQHERTPARVEAFRWPL